MHWGFQASCCCCFWICQKCLLFSGHYCWRTFLSSFRWRLAWSVFITISSCYHPWQVRNFHLDQRYYFMLRMIVHVCWRMFISTTVVLVAIAFRCRQLGFEHRSRHFRYRSRTIVVGFLSCLCYWSSCHVLFVFSFSSWKFGQRLGSRLNRTVQASSIQSLLMSKEYYHFSVDLCHLGN